MTRRRKVCWWALGLSTVALLSPIWGFEFLYHYALGRTGVPPGLPNSDVPALAQDLLWTAEYGDLRNADVPFLWAGNYFTRPWAGAHGQLARLWYSRVSSSPRTVAERHLVLAALAVWFSRHVTVAQMKHGLAEWTYFGRDAYGVRAAARAYFGTKVENLTVAQLALLMGMPQSPGRFDPACFGKRARKRREHVLARALEYELVGAEAYAQARAEPLSFTPRPCPTLTPGNGG